MIAMLLGGPDDARMVGIWGMVGIGKTTIAKAIYNQFFFIVLNETFKEPDGKVGLQKQLLSDILKTSKISISNVARRINMIRERLCTKRVLVILDDIDQEEQLHVIAGKRNTFGSESIIIITTRDEHLLKGLEVDEIYTAKEMDSHESLELFSWHAYRNSNPPKIILIYQEVSLLTQENCHYLLKFWELPYSLGASKNGKMH